MDSVEVANILNNVRRRLEGIESLLEHFYRIPSQSRRNVSRIAIEGRAVTSVLQRLRTPIPDFDTWYKIKVSEMASDALLRFFYQLRTDTLKKGDDHVKDFSFRLRPGTRMLVNNEGILFHKMLNDGQVVKFFYEQPKNTVATLAINTSGQTGFLVQVSKTEKKMQYVNVPEDIFEIHYTFKNPPTSFLGKPINTADVFVLSQLYVSYLRDLYDEAKKKYTSPNDDWLHLEQPTQ